MVHSRAMNKHVYDIIGSGLVYFSGFWLTPETYKAVQEDVADPELAITSMKSDSCAPCGHGLNDKFSWE